MKFLDTILSVALLFPFLWLFLRDHQKFTSNAVFFRYFFMALGLVGLGIVSKAYFKTENNTFFYFGSQSVLVMVVLYQLIRIPYYFIYKRNPEIAEHPNHLVDIIPGIIVFVGALVLPLLFDSYIVENL